MKRIYILFSLFFFTVNVFSYNITKNYGGTILWEYEIKATNESLYSINDEGEEIYSHTLIIRDSKSKINYTIYCESENDTLKTYFEYINKYPTIEDIRDKLIPELQKQISAYSSSDDGTWMFCYINSYVNSYYSDIPDSTLKNLFYEKYDSGIFTGKELIECAFDLFDEEGEFWQAIFGADEKFDSEQDMYKYIINYIIEEYETEENSEDITKLKNELLSIIQEE